MFDFHFIFWVVHSSLVSAYIQASHFHQNMGWLFLSLSLELRIYFYHPIEEITLVSYILNRTLKILACGMSFKFGVEF